MAIALLPLLDGETIGSNLGRYGDFIGLDTTLALRRCLFGYACKPDTRLPSGLDHVAEEARDYWNVDADAIINDHTEFQYATVTLPEIQRQAMRSDMREQPAGRCLRRSACGWSGELVAGFRCGFRGRRTLVSVKSNKLEGGAARCMDCSVSVRDQATPSSGLFFRRIESPFSGSLWA